MMQFLAVLIAAASLCAALVVLSRPHLAFVLLMVLFPLKQLLQVYVPFVARHPSYVNIAVGLLALFAVITRYARREQIGSAYLNRVTVLVLALYGLWFLGLLYSPMDIQSVYWDRLPTDVMYMGLLLVLMPLLVLDIFEFRRALYALMIVGSIICVLIMVNPNSSYRSGRLVLDLGMMVIGRETGSALATASLGAMTALVAALIRPARATFLVTTMRVAAFIAGMGMAIGSGSRGQVLAASIVGILFFPLSRKLANPRQFFVVTTGFMVLVVGIYGVFKLFVGDQNQARWNPLEMFYTAIGRMEMVMHLFNHYLASPAHWLFGLGTGAYASISIERTVERDYVHNVAAEVLCEHGIVGAIFFVGMIVLLFKYGKRLWMLYRDDPAMRSTVALLGAICVFTLLESLKQGSMHYPAPFFWWIIMAKLARHEETMLEPAGEPELDYAAATDEYDGLEYAPTAAH